MIKELILIAYDRVSEECDKEIQCEDCKFSKELNGEWLCFVIYNKYKKSEINKI